MQYFHIFILYAANFPFNSILLLFSIYTGYVRQENVVACSEDITQK